MAVTVWLLFIMRGKNKKQWYKHDKIRGKCNFYFISRYGWFLNELDGV